MGHRLLAGVLCFLFCICCISLQAAPPASESLPTADELHKLYDDKEYQQVLQKMVRILQLKGQAAQAYDRVDLLMLRGESLLQLKQQSSALEAFDAAAKEATAPQPNIQRKPEQVALARATDLLMHQSHNFAYTPKHAPPGQPATPISLLDRSQRDAAFKALLADQLAEMEPKAKAASRGTTLAPIIQLIRSLGDLRAVELTVTKATKDSDAIFATMADRAHGLMEAEVDRLAPAEQKISRLAHEQTERVLVNRDRHGNLISETTTVTKRGLYSGDINDLKQIVAECQQIDAAAHDFQGVTSGKQASDFERLSTKAEKLATAATQTLNDDYTPVSNTTQGVRVP